MSRTGSLPIFAADAAGAALADEVAARHGLERLAVAPERDALYLLADGDGLAVHRGSSRQRPVRADFLSAAIEYRRRYGGGYRQPLARAVGVTGKSKPEVLDTTAGLGRDSFILATLGCRVTLLERSAVVGALLADGLRRGRGDRGIAPSIARMSLVIADAAAWLADPRERPFDVIYIDPMFPERRKSALVKGEMQLLHELIGTDEEVDPLLAAALGHHDARVVVKRPRLGAGSLLREPDFVLRGKSSRFDVYLPRPTTGISPPSR